METKEANHYHAVLRDIKKMTFIDDSEFVVIKGLVKKGMSASQIVDVLTATRDIEQQLFIGGTL